MKRELRRVHRSHHSSLNELNITPLLDLVFVLLVIFILTTPQLTNNLELSLPSTQPAPQNKPKPKLSTVTITAQGHIQLDGQEMTTAQFKATLAAMKTADPEVGVVVRGEDDADYQRIDDVLDILQQLEITKVGIATETINAKLE